MKLQTLLKLLEDSNGKGHDFARIVHASINAYRSLSHDAKEMIKEWQRANWHVGALEQAAKEQNENLVEIKRAFEPVRATLHQVFGDDITLYRGQRKVADDEMDKGRVLFSWSYDKNVAQDFALNGKLSREISDADIQKAVERYNRTGYVKFLGHSYVRSKQDPKYFMIYDRDRQQITDGDDLEGVLKSEQQDRKSYNDRLRSNGDVVSRKVSIDKIVWITNQLGSKEFIVALNPLTD